LGAAGYTIGRAQGGSTERSPTSTCEAAQAALHQHLATADPKDATAAHTIANLVVGNASCFDPETVAEMQTMLDGLR